MDLSSLSNLSDWNFRNVSEGLHEERSQGEGNPEDTEGTLSLQSTETEFSNYSLFTILWRHS